MKSLSKAQLLKLLAAARAYRERDWLLLLVCFWHGLSTEELISFQRDAIAEGCLKIRRSDGSGVVEHMLVEHPVALLNEKNALVEFVRRVDCGIPVFALGRRRVEQLMKQYCAEADIPSNLAHPKTLRHTVARLSIEAGGIELARRWLGHESRTSVNEYLTVTDGGVDPGTFVSARSLSCYDPFTIFTS
jgi:integrase